MRQAIVRTDRLCHLATDVETLALIAISSQYQGFGELAGRAVYLQILFVVRSCNVIVYYFVREGVSMRIKRRDIFFTLYCWANRLGSVDFYYDK